MVLHVYLIGMPGAGKSTLGRLLARELQLPFVDLDEEIEKTGGATIPEIFAKEGEAYFRELESRVLKTVSFSAEKLVIATGGGTPCFHENLAFMQAQGLTIYLKVPAETLVARLKQTEAEKRPLLKNFNVNPGIAAYLLETLARRETFYRQAGIIFESPHVHASPDEAAKALVNLIDRYGPVA